MRKFLLQFCFLIFTVLWGCNRNPEIKEKVYYFYDSGMIFEKEQSDHMVRFVYKKPIIEVLDDTLKYIRGTCVYGLVHYNGDEVFIKQKSFMDSIQYYDAEWLKNELNPHLFWQLTDNESSIRWRVDWGSFYRSDTLKIYYIENINNSDSLLFWRVNREVFNAE